ncbi:hypothetical protein [Mesorhizobium sp. SP-1A]|uniref:hypothetical protein n=1 Tax=Mesorhizobium sp. SP-1A TaxID=3077840 RepID=UPI0028F6C876|nr:hypothetical protein [Mesorhizobium sp. SP-1A]
MQPILDLTGRPAGYFGATLGKRISWQAFAQLTDRPIPPGAYIRPKINRPRPEPRPQPSYWLGRERRFPRRYTDHTRFWKGWPSKAAEAASRPLQALLRPLSATSFARTALAAVAVPDALVKAPAARRNPLAEEHTAGRISGRHINAADWFATDIHATASARASGVRMRTSSGAMVPCGSRDPLALWPAEAAADTAIRLRHRFRTLGPLARIVWRALNGADMAELAPAWQFPQRHKAEAGRIRLRAGLELCARMAERDVDRLPLWEVLEVTRAACAECTRLEATRRMRVLIPANDNIPQRIAA